MCQGEGEHWKRRALRTASPCYRAVTSLEEISKVCNLSFYWFPISYLTFDFPLQLGFNLYFSTLVSTIQLPRGLLKAASDIKFQLSYCVKSLKPQPLESSGVLLLHLFFVNILRFRIVHLHTPLSIRSWNGICCQLITK